MKYLIDTNLWIDAMSGKIPAIELLHTAVEAEWSGYSAITRLELFSYPALKKEDEKKISDLLNYFTEIDVTSAVIDRTILLRQANRIKVPDALIAATALLIGASLATRNVDDFKGISLDIINPFDT